MGYTHYWKITQRLDSPNELHHISWYDFLEDVEQIISFGYSHFEYAVADPMGERLQDYEISDKYIALNGFGSEAHESFVFTPAVIEFDFCKTAQKPYDNVVTAILILAKEYFPEWLEVTSDGTKADWQKGYYLFRASMQREPRVTIEDHKLTAWQQSTKTYEVYVKRTEYGLVEVEAETPEQAKEKADEYVIEGMTKWGACFETYWTENEDEPQLTKIGNEK